jgi:outer membrane lipoprotein-sorting protein
MRWARSIIWGLAAVVSMSSSQPGALAEALEPASEDVNAAAIARRAEDTLRGDRAFLDGSMVVRTRKGEAKRTLQFRAFDDRARGRSFVRMQDSGNGRETTFLKLLPNLWKYDSKEEATERVPPEQLHESFMKGDFTNDEMLHVSSLLDDYDHELLGIDPNPDGVADRRAYVVAYIPRESAPHAQGRIVAWIDTEWGTPLRHEYHDADGQLLRVVHFGGIREVQERFFPHVWVARSQDDPRHETRIEVERVEFGAEFDPEIFTPRHMRATE